MWVQEPVEPRGPPVCFGVILKNTVPLPPRRQGLSLAQSPPIRLDWLSSEPYSFPVSKTFPLLGVQVQTTMRDIARAWTQVLMFLPNDLFLKALYLT